MNCGFRTVLLACCLASAGVPAFAQSNAVYYWRNLAGEPGVAGTNDGVGTNAQFQGPQDVAVDGAGNVYVSDSFNYTIRKIARDGTVTTLAGVAGVSGTNDGTGTNALFEFPYALALDGATNLFVTDLRGYVQGYLRKVTGAGAVTTVGFVGNGTYSMAIDSSTNVYLGQYENNEISELTVTGSNEILNIFRNSKAMTLNRPTGIAVDGATNLYVADNGNYIIRKLTQAGTNWLETTLAGNLGHYGTSDGVGTNALFEAPQGVAVDSATNLYVGDGTTVRRISTAGVVTTIGGAPSPGGIADGTNTAARFGLVVGVAVDNAGNVYAADYANNRISKGTLLPPLNVVSSGTNVIVAWPSSFIAWTLQQNTDANNPAGWIGTSYPTNDDGTNKSINVPLPAGNLFFRLMGN
jgi:hypothetical protein